MSHLASRIVINQPSLSPKPANVTIGIGVKTVTAIQSNYFVSNHSCVTIKESVPLSEDTDFIPSAQKCPQERQAQAKKAKGTI